MTYPSLLIAAVLAIALGVAHSWLGERRLIGPLLSSENRVGLLASSTFARNVLRFAWHITSIAWWGMGAALAVLATSNLDAQGKQAVVVLAATFLVTGLVIFAASRGRHLAWPVFVAIACLSVVPIFG